jgi:hypothetical protein
MRKPSSSQCVGYLLGLIEFVDHPSRPGQGKSRVGVSRALTTREPLRTFARVKEIPIPIPMSFVRVDGLVF